MLSMGDQNAVDGSLAKKRFSARRLKVLVIVASTGGPEAIQKILKQLPASCPLPILIIQHMPAHFTQNFADRLNVVSKIQVREAQHGDTLKAGLALVAPGGMQMEVHRAQAEYCVALRPKTTAELYAPCADVSLNSVAQCFKQASLSLILTGMGADGKVGAAALKQQGAWIWAQEESSCTIYGMPKAVIDAHLADKVLNLDDIALEFSKLH